MANSKSNQQEGFLAAVGDWGSEAELDGNAGDEAAAPLLADHTQTSGLTSAHIRRLQAIENSSLNTPLELHGSHSTGRWEQPEPVTAYLPGGTLTAPYLIVGSTRFCEAFTHPTNTISSLDNRSVTNYHNTTTTSITQPSLTETSSTYAHPNEIYLDSNVRLTGNEFIYTYSTASSSAQQPASKRLKIDHPSRREITASRSSAGNTTKKRRIPAKAIMQFQNWMKSHPGMIPSPDEIDALKANAKVPYDVVHRWFYNQSLSRPQARQEPPHVEGTTEGLELSGRIPTDKRHEDLSPIWSDVSRLYSRNREKCTESITDTDKERNKEKAWDPGRNFSCTSLCGATFKSKCDWIRHEHNNRPQEGWICDLGETWCDSSCKKCTLCDQSEPDARHFHLAHKGKVPCSQKDFVEGKNGRVFLRKDKMNDHLKAVHSHLNSEEIIDTWKFTTSGNFPRRCGFCGKFFETWDQRNDCIAKHFRAGVSMKTWRDPWVDYSSSESPEGGDNDDNDDNDNDENRDEGMDHQDDDDREDEDDDYQEEEEEEEEDDDDDDDDDMDDGDQDDDHEGGNNNGGGSNSGNRNGRNGTGPEDSFSDPRNQFGGSGSSSSGDGDDPGSSFFNFVADQNFFELYEVLRHFLLEGRIDIVSSVGCASKLQCQISTFLLDYQPSDASVLFRVDMAKSKLSAIVVPQQRISRGHSLGFGGIGVVREVDMAVSTIRNPLVLKELNNGPLKKEHQLSLVREFICMNVLRHSHILDGVGLLVKPFECGLIMPVADRNLKDLLEQEQKLLELLVEDLGCVVSAVAHMHNCNVIHGDIKPENILLMKTAVTNKLVLSDFGSSKLLFAKGILSSPVKGLTPKYAAPETAYNRVCSLASDIWSLGCVFLELLISFCSKGKPNTLRLAKANPRMPYYSILPEIHTWLITGITSKDLPLNSTQIHAIRQMLDLDVHVRPSASELLHCFPPRPCCCPAQDMCLGLPANKRNTLIRAPFQEPKISEMPGSGDTLSQSTATFKSGTLSENSLAETKSAAREPPSDQRASIAAASPATGGSGATPFVFRRLDAEKQIRLLRFGGSSGNSSVHCSLVPVDLQDAPEYFALSYVWGDPTVKERIFVDRRAVPVTQNLYAALQQLRKRGPSLLYWIDALCVDQEDLSEKKAQVMLMSEIYKTAKTVIVWLGESEPSSKSSFKYLDRLHKDLKHSSTHSAITVTEQSLPKDLWSALHALTTRPWFSRRWVIQEIALARAAYVLFGEDVLSWQDFADAVSYFAHRIDVRESKKFSAAGHPWQNSCGCVFSRFRFLHLQSTPMFRLHRTLSVFQAMRNNPTKMPLVELLERFRDFETTDARDRVYALLGLACDASQLKIFPDYSKPSYEVYTTVAARLIIDYNNLSVLTSSELHRNRTLLPSWVPDWSIKSKTSRVGWPFFSASRASELKVNFQTDSSLMCVKGIWVDVLERVGRPWNCEHRKGQDVAATARRFLCGIKDLIGAFKKEPADQRILAEAVWATSNGGLELTDDGKWRKSTFSYDAYIEAIGYSWTQENINCGSEDSLLKSDAERFHTTLSIRCKSRRAFITGQGYIGLGPDAARPGDIVVVFFGANVPLILREIKDDKFLLVGECYVHGIMDGEIMEGDHEARYFTVV